MYCSVEIDNYLLVLVSLICVMICCNCLLDWSDFFSHYQIWYMNQAFCKILKIIYFSNTYMFTISFSSTNNILLKKICYLIITNSMQINLSTLMKYHWVIYSIEILIFTAIILFYFTLITVFCKISYIFDSNANMVCLVLL